jgi:hypothetical protein
MVDASPLPGTPAFAEVGGAWINVFTTEETEDAALLLAAREIAEAGWQVRAIEETSVVTRESFEDAPDGLQYFEQALLDGVVLVIHTYSADDGDAH